MFSQLGEISNSDISHYIKKRRRRSKDRRVAQLIPNLVTTSGNLSFVVEGDGFPLFFLSLCMHFGTCICTGMHYISKWKNLVGNNSP